MKLQSTIVILVLAFVLLAVIPATAENVYVNNNPALFEVLPMDSYGYVVFYARGVSVQDPNIYVDTYPSNRIIDNRYHPDHTNITDKNKDMLLVVLRPDGVSDPVLLNAGEYIAYMRQGNGDQPEQQRFKIGGGATERVVFLGAAIPTVHKEICEVFTVLDKAGFIIHHDEVNHTIHHEAETHIVTIVDKEAWDETVTDVEPWDETIYHQEVNHTVHHAAITHQITVVDKEAWDKTVHHGDYNYVCVETTYKTIHHSAIPAVPAVPAVPEYYEIVSSGSHTGHANKVTNGQYDFKIGNQKYKIDNNGAYKYLYHPAISAVPAVPAVPAWDEQVVDVPGHCDYVYVGRNNGDYTWCYNGYRYVAPTTIQHAAVTHQETVVDTPAWDEIVVDTPAWIETIHHEAETHTVHHEAITHEETVTDKEAWDEIVVDEEAWDEQVGAITHKEVICNKYGNPVPPKGAIFQR
jgi:hypothetical protein